MDATVRVNSKSIKVSWSNRPFLDAIPMSIALGLLIAARFKVGHENSKASSHLYPELMPKAES